MFVGKVGARTTLHFKQNPQHYIKFEGRSTLSIIVNKMGHSIIAEKSFAESYLCWLSLMLSVTYKPLLLSAIMLSVMTPFEVPLIGEHFSLLCLSVSFYKK